MALTAQAQQLLDSGRAREAQLVIAKAIAGRDDIAAIYIVQGRIALALGSRGSAYQAYANALSLEATNPEALITVAQLGLATGHWREAEDAAERILSLDPANTQALLVKGIAAIVRNNRAGAISFADQILKAKPDDEGGLILKARALALDGQRQQALELVQQGIARTGYTSGMTMSLAELYRAQGNAQPFLDMVSRITTADATNLPYRFDLADTLYKTGRIDEARRQVADLLDSKVKKVEDLDQVIRLWNAYDVEALSPALIEQLSKTASIEARTATARYFIATDRPQIALELLRTIATGWSSEIQALNARALDRTGQADAAQRTAAEILVRDPDNGDALLIRARHAVMAGRAEAAVVDLQRVIQHYPSWDEGYLALAAAYRASNKQAGVRRAYEDGLRARPQSYPLAVAYVKQLIALGDWTRAVEVTRRFALDSPALTRGWQLFAQTCAQHPDVDCRSDSQAGLDRSRTMLGLDPVPDAPPPVSLIGRLT